VAKEITSYISIGQGNQILDELWFFAGSGATNIHTHTHTHAHTRTQWPDGWSVLITSIAWLKHL